MANRTMRTAPVKRTKAQISIRSTFGDYGARYHPEIDVYQNVIATPRTPAPPRKTRFMLKVKGRDEIVIKKDGRIVGKMTAQQFADLLESHIGVGLK